MIVEKEVLKVWKKEIAQENIYYEAKAMGADPRTLKSALDTGKCYKSTYDKITNYLLEKRKNKNPLLK